MNAVYTECFFVGAPDPASVQWTEILSPFEFGPVVFDPNAPRVLH